MQEIEKHYFFREELFAEWAAYLVISQTWVRQDFSIQALFQPS